jgi:hypothetical protein
VDAKDRSLGINLKNIVPFLILVCAYFLELITNSTRLKILTEMKKEGFSISFYKNYFQESNGVVVDWIQKGAAGVRTRCFGV